MVLELMFSDQKPVSLRLIGSRICVVIYQTAQSLSSFVIICFETLNLGVTKSHVEAEKMPRTYGMINAMWVEQRLSDGRVM
jgi:hypothetical protein